jgi:hypothetical protein
MNGSGRIMIRESRRGLAARAMAMWIADTDKERFQHLAFIRELVVREPNQPGMLVQAHRALPKA